MSFRPLIILCHLVVPYSDAEEAVRKFSFEPKDDEFQGVSVVEPMDLEAAVLVPNRGFHTCKCSL